jgi:hypothetical protein
MSMLALVATVLWVAFPVVMASANAAHSNGETCSCCEEQAALGGVIACPGCQVETPAETVLPIAELAVTTAWLGTMTASATAIDLASPEPPPR